jgi:hypothetical protein
VQRVQDLRVPDGEGVRELAVDDEDGARAQPLEGRGEVAPADRRQQLDVRDDRARVPGRQRRAEERDERSRGILRLSSGAGDAVDPRGWR